MAAAYFLSHGPRGFCPLLNRGEPATLFCFVWLYISAAGPWASRPCAGDNHAETARHRAATRGP